MNALSLPANWTHRHYETVASTMLCCDPFAVEPGHFLLITADEQTAGRGQRGTHWESTKGENLTFNIGWRAPLHVPTAPLQLPRPLPPPSPIGREPLQAGGGLVGADRPRWPAANEQFLISEITALAVARTIAAFLPENLRSDVCIKWPNDIYFVQSSEDSSLRSSEPSPYRGELEGGCRELEGGFKICGMLLEHSLSGRRIEASIAGIGINVNQQSFATLEGREEGRGAPISLRQILGHEVSREAVLEAFVRHFMDGIALLREGRYDDVERTFTAHLYRRTGLHRYRDVDGPFLAEFVSIARNGTLTLRKADGTLRDYAFKEVAYVI